MSQKRCSKTEKFNQNKIKCESAVTVGKTLHVFILKASDPNDINIKAKLLNVMSNTQLRSRFTKDEHPFLKSGVVFSNLDTLDICMLHKLVYYLCDLENKAPELESNLRTLKNNRNDIAHNTDLNKFTDLFTFRKIEELRVLFETILKGIENLYVTNIDDKIKEINIELDNILENVEVEVGDLEIEALLKDLQDIGKCPFKVKIEIKDYPTYCSELIPLLETLGKDITRETRVRFQVYKPFFDDVDLQFYDSQKYLSPLLDEESRCQLTWYRGNMSNEMISVLPPTMKQLYLRMRSDQIEHLNNQLPKLLDLWNLVLYLDLSENGNIYGLDTIDPSSLPMIDFKVIY
ncbi:unnamed protein product [Meganyctiphanes norvegica]|uniref:DZIP3-like HEPN domain-containing protein n=1 Tax=Meganyctiphanes norvegica TaxID=48144 RepID=A0AAV2S6Z0_MEGNR